MAIRRVVVRRGARLVTTGARTSPISRPTSGVPLTPIVTDITTVPAKADQAKLDKLKKTGITKAAVAVVTKKKEADAAKTEAEAKVKAAEKKTAEEERKAKAAEEKKKKDKEKADEAAEKMAAEVRRRKLREQMAAAMVAQYTKVPDKYEKPINIVNQADGIYEVRVNRIGEFITKTASVKIPGGESKLKQGFIYKLPRKVPLNFLLHTIKFFKLVNTHYGSEAYQQYFWDQEEGDNGSFFMNYPIQDCSGGHVDYLRDPELEQQKLLMVDIHSHNTMGAFFSGVDDSDEKENRIFGVIGKILQPVPDMKFRISSAGKHVIIHPMKIFDIDHIDDEVALYPEDKREEAKKDLEQLAESLRNFTLGAAPTTTHQSGGTYWNGQGRGGSYYPQGGMGGINRNPYARSGGHNYSKPAPTTPAKPSSDIWTALDPDQVYLIKQSDNVDEVFKEIILKWEDEQIRELVELLVGSNLGEIVEESLEACEDAEEELACAEDDASAGMEIEVTSGVPRESVEVKDDKPSLNEGTE